MLNLKKPTKLQDVINEIKAIRQVSPRKPVYYRTFKLPPAKSLSAISRLRKLVNQ